MCLTCGCGQPTNPHGDGRNLLLADLVAAAQAGGVTVEQAADNIPATLAGAITPTPPIQPGPLPTLVVDLDGLLAYTAEAYCCAVNAAFGTSYSADTISVYPISGAMSASEAQWLLAQQSQPDIFENVAPDWHAIDTINAAHRAGYHVIIATERRTQLAAVTGEWLDRREVHRDELRVLGPGGRAPMVTARFGRDQPAVVLDDKPAAEILLPRPGIQVWVPPRPYRPTSPPRPGVWRFNHWHAVRRALNLT